VRREEQPRQSPELTVAPIPPNPTPLAGERRRKKSQEWSEVEAREKGRWGKVVLVLSLCLTIPLFLICNKLNLSSSS